MRSARIWSARARPSAHRSRWPSGGPSLGFLVGNIADPELVQRPGIPISFDCVDRVGVLGLADRGCAPAFPTDAPPNPAGAWSWPWP